MIIAETAPFQTLPAFMSRRGRFGMLVPVDGRAVRRGVGDAASDVAQFAGTGGSIASGAVALTTSAATASVVVPIIGIGVAAVIGAIALIKNSGCGQTCIITADDANKIEPYLQANLKGYFEGPRTVASREAALQNADYFLNYLAQACGQPALGNAGKRCISDRQAGACVWKQTEAGYNQFPYPGVPKPGECWNWVSGYRDPIANDPGVTPSSTLDAITGGASIYDVFAAAASSGGLFGLSWGQLLIPVLLLVALWVIA